MERLTEGLLEEYFDKKNIGLLGFGNIGKGIYGALRNYNCRFWIIRKKPMKTLDKVVYCNDLDGLCRVLESCDVTINTLPQSQETSRIGENKTYLLKQGSVVVNLSRSGILNEKEILEKVKKGALKSCFQ